MKRNIVSASVVALTIVLGFAVIASANNGALADFNTKYPGNRFGNSCNICHAGGMNPYGAALKSKGGKADNIPDAAFTEVEGVDSDGDGFTNLAEINAATFPGDRNSFPTVPAEIKSILPSAGTLGTQFSIGGSGFGAKKGKVVLSSDLGSATLKIANGGWTGPLISATLTKALPAGAYDVMVYLQPYKTTSPIPGGAFTVMAPALDLGQEISGPPDAEITITGYYFGTTKGKVSIEGTSKGKTKRKSCKVTFWDMHPATGVNTLSFLVPKGLDPGTYPLTVTSKVGSASTTITIP